MSIIRSYTDNFGVIDRTSEVVSIPNQWGLINSLGIFGAPEGIMTNTVSFEDIVMNAAALKDQIRGQRNIYGKADVRKLRSYPVPHYPMDEHISPEDVQGKTAYGTNDQAETTANVIARKLEKIRRAQSDILETARAKLLEDGTVYAPNGTVAVNFYSDFGVTREEIDFTFGTTTSDIIGKVKDGVDYIIDNKLSGGMSIDSYVALCSPTFFANFIKHNKVQAAYTYYSQTVGQNPLRDSLRGSLPAGTQEFTFGGVRFIQYRGKTADGTAYIPDGEARLVPTGMFDVFQTFVAPALKMDLVNTVGQEAYVFQYNDPKGNGIDLEGETNLINVVKKPQLIVKLYSSN